MRKLRLGTGALVGLLATAPAVTLMVLADRLAGLPFVPFDLFDWTTRVLPGGLVTFGIDSMIAALEFVGLDVADTAKTAERATAVLAFVVLGAVAGALFFAFFALRRSRPDAASGLVMGALLGLPLAAISLAIGGARERPLVSVLWLALVFLGWGVLVAWGFRRTVPAAAAGTRAAGAASVERLDRRRFLVRLGAASAVVTVAGAGLARVLARSEGGGELAASGAHRTETGKGSPFPNAGDPVMPAPGTRPEYTPLKDHYKVFIRTEPEEVDGERWRLEVTGRVDRPLRLTLGELRSRYPVHDQYVTLSCISGRVGTGLIGTTLWSGARLQDVLADAGLRDGARFLHVRSADGYYETVDLELVRADPRILLCYDWDGHPLPSDHGFPLRIWLPDRYGMKQPKWIESIEVSSEYVPGYWVERNWDREARMKATSVIDTVAVAAAQDMGGRRLIPVGGIAHAGARGISRVEVRVDGGPWQEAKLRAPLSETTWVLWRHDWPFAEGDHTFEVRCAEADGTPQIEERRPQRPSGATGLHRLEMET
ncbi:MAG TPA: molybdopterin-dependent oxidoreductase [Thermoanaerobaculia bacterium]|nr:molybdopterin-dependent oxidoreductase [Thermoanaerobaculia bacterium]